MTDIWGREKRSYVMSRIVSEKTKPEILVQKIVKSLHRKFDSNSKTLPGKPDLVFQKSKQVIFVNGCFWHQHKNCVDGKVPKTHKKYWNEKLIHNVERDKRNNRKLKKMGWKVLRLWECRIVKRPDDEKEKIKKFLIKTRT